MKKIKSELTNKENQNASDQDFLRWIDGELKKAANVTDAPKRIKMDVNGKLTRVSIKPAPRADALFITPWYPWLDT